MQDLRPSALMKRYFDGLEASLAPYREPSTGEIGAAWRTEIDACPACAGGDLLPAVRKGPLRYASCRDCRTMFQSPALNGKALAHWYETSESARLGEDIRRRTFQSRKEGKFGPITERYANLLRGVSLLDVGCSWGYFMELAQERYGAMPEGIELNPHTAQDVVSRTGMTVYTEDIRVIEGLEQRFDTITCFGTITHVAEPFSFLKACYNVLRPGGSLIISTPNCRGFEFALGPYHESFQGTVLTLFSTNGLSTCLERAGFRPTVKCLGSRDVESIRAMVDRNPTSIKTLPAFLQDVLRDTSDAGDTMRSELQRWITSHELSGYMEAVGSKPPGGERA